MTSFVFPGQGSQFVGMAKDFYDNFDKAKNIFEEISEHSKLDLKKIIFEGYNNLIDNTQYTQISIFTASLAIYKSIEDQNIFDSSSISVMMGHSLGEYSALACSNKLSIKEASLILKKRGELMNNAVEPNKSGMAAIIGANSQQVEKIIQDNNIKLEIANDNSPIQVVVSGDKNEITKSKEIFINNKVKKYVLLNVSAAFHSNYMLDSEKQLSEEISKLNFLSNDIKIVSNYTADLSSDNSIIMQSLQKQMASKVRWTESIKKLEEFGENKIIEIGPGKVLSGLIKRISNQFDIISINNITDIK